MQNIENTKYSGIEELLNLEVMTNYNAFIVQQALKYKTEAANVIDFGAGIGTLASIFRENYKIIPLCVEIDATNKTFLSERDFKYVDSLREIPIEADLIFSSNVLEHVEDDLSVLELMQNKIRADGMIYLYLPAKKSLWTNLDERVGHYRRYEIDEIREKCQKVGLEVVEAHYADSVGYFASLFLKLVTYNSDQGVVSVPSLVFYDKWLFPISRIVDALGCKYLFGKNLIVHAKRALN
ncbi:MAG: hypothetical protein CFH41_02202 [Alphaproteobacteria bacterium MarineAlpha11_Bin1]|nr:MAG: hypothetical protein CFH41_02202 [Alphaproteobacteria bacterium MarineAlpha11_Bin1]|tara:strand:+ start:1132 stop:1845 length:714 start_codon:yes stop_codon:yes gene_type:complete